MKNILFLFIVFVSCSVTREKESNKKEESDSIVFVVLNIHKNSSNTKNIVELVSKKESNGQMKKQRQTAFDAENYLSIFVYNNKKPVDTILIEHPLYKHLEYVDENNAFAAKDTILDHAEFFIRVQTRGNSNEIKIVETLKNKAKKELTTIKL